MSFLKKIFGSKSTPAAAIDSFDAFWNWFQQHEKTFAAVVKQRGNIEKDFFDKVSAKLAELRENIYLVTGMPDDQTVELIFTAEGMIKNIAFVEDLVNAAPPLPGWLFTALKAHAGESMGIKMQDIEFSADNMHFYASENAAYPDEIGITVVHDNFSKQHEELITNGVYIFLDNYLGELNFAEQVDLLHVTGKENATEPLIPMEKLPDYLTWRQKEFIEKYDGTWYDVAHENYTVMQAALQSGKPLLAVFNQELLNWDAKASHPWILKIEMSYKRANDSGMPDEASTQQMNDFEDHLSKKLQAEAGCLNIGRETADGLRCIYFACKDYRTPSRILPAFIKANATRQNIEFSIFKDKYWQSLEKFQKGSAS